VVNAFALLPIFGMMLTVKKERDGARRVKVALPALRVEEVMKQATTCEAGTFHNIGLDVGRRWMDGLVLFFYM